jgi:hypothetical protein
VSPAKSNRGRPIVHTEPWAKITVVLLDRHVALIDAIEVNAMYLRGLDFNRPAIAWARGRGKPMVGNSDLHMLEQMGTTYSLVDADARADAVCEAIRSGRVEVRSEPLPPFRAMRLFSMMCWGGIRGRACIRPHNRLGAVHQGDSLLFLRCLRIARVLLSAHCEFRDQVCCSIAAANGEVAHTLTHQHKFHLPGRSG